MARTLQNNSETALSYEELENSFKMFTKLADDLTGAYSELQAHVNDLNKKLETVSQARLSELNEKERIANRLQMLLSMLPAAVVVLDGNGVIKESNPAAVDLLSDDLMGKSWRDIIQDCFRPREDDGHEISLNSGRRVNIATRALGEEPGQIIVMVDMTETRMLQERLSRDKRLSAMGKMVASLAHQIRTPLTTALLYASHLTDHTLCAQNRHKFAQQIISRLQSIEKQVKDMLLCAKGEHLVFESLSLHHLISEISKSSEQHLDGSTIALAIECNETQAELECNSDALVGAIQNIINNAVEAQSKQIKITFSANEQSHQLYIRIQDDGPGIPAEILDKVTEPFFTTRIHGTGLGLDVVRAVVSSHGGEFNIDSNMDEGTCVTIVLPLIRASSFDTGIKL